MIKNLKINAHEIVPEIILLDLPKVSVICGPNNSGKSTLLRAINDQKQTSQGEVLTDASLEGLHRACLSHAGLAIQPNEPGYRYMNQVIKQVANNEVWFVDQVDKFEEGVRGHYLGRRTRLPFNLSSLRQNLIAILDKPTISSILLPPKRNLEIAHGVQTNQSISPNGAGVLNYLFTSKNQIATSENRKLFERIKEAFILISGGFKFDIELGDNNNLYLKFSPKTGLWIPAEQCGLGLQDLLVILYFAIASDYNLICIEEPESHLHPDMQRRLLVYLNGIDDRQFILTTHSNVFLNNALVDKVWVTNYTNDSIYVSDATSRASMLADLGYSVADNLVSDLVVLVEGPTDVPILEEFFFKMGLLQDFEIKVWPLGGDIMAQLDLTVFSQSYRLISLLDKDPKSSKVRNRFAQKCQQHGIPIHILKRYAIENYFSLRALKKVFGVQIPGSITKLDSNKKLQSQIGINVKKNNRKIARTMSFEEIKDTDFGLFLSKVEALCRQSAPS